MEALEIQVLSGVHAGARYRITRPVFRLAADKHAELVLLDEGLDDVELGFHLTDNGDLAVMSRVPYEIVDQYSVPVRPKTRWALGQFLVIANVWLALGRAGDALMEKPGPKPAELAAEFAEALKRPLGRAPRPALQAVESLSPPEDPAERAQARRARKVASIALGAIVAMVLIAGFGVALLALNAESTLQSARATDAAKAKKLVVALAATSATLAPSPEEVALMRIKTAQEALDRMLERAGLASSVSVKWEQGAVDVEARINPGAVPKFEQVVTDFERDHGACCKVAAKVTPLWTLLPFRIREVVPGQNGWIVTDSGERVMLGGAVAGYKLTSLAQEKVVFSGPQEVEIDL